MHTSLTYPQIISTPLDPEAVEVTLNLAPEDKSDIWGNHRFTRERIICHPNFLARTGLPRRTNIRGTSVTEGWEAIFTIVQTDKNLPDDLTMWCGPDAFARFGLEGVDTMKVTFDTQITRNDLSLAQAELQGEFREQLFDNGVQDSLIILSPHGGNIEDWTTDMAQDMYTDLQALSKPCSHWDVSGWAEDGHPSNDFIKWHVTSVDIYPPNYPMLQNILGRNFEYGISFHGFTNTMKIEVGGQADEAFLTQVQTALQNATTGVDVVITNDELILGVADRNITNRLSQQLKTVQLEISRDVRQNQRAEVVTAMVNFYKDLI